MENHPSAPPYVPTPPPTGPIQNRPSDGQTLGIIGLILGLLALWPVGLPLSIASVVKAQKARGSKVVGIVGIVFNALAVFVSLFIITIAIVAYNGIQQRAHASAAEASANVVAKKAEAYATIDAAGSYPATIEDFAKYPESKLIQDDYTVTTVPPVDEKTIMYKQCDAQSAQVTYYDTYARQTRIIPLGDASNLTSC